MNQIIATQMLVIIIQPITKVQLAKRTKESEREITSKELEFVTFHDSTEGNVSFGECNDPLLWWEKACNMSFVYAERKWWNGLLWLKIHPVSVWWLQS